MKQKIIRITTVPISLKILLAGQLRFMSQFYDIIGISSQGDDLLDVERDEGVKVIPIEMSRRISPLLDLISLWKLYKVFRHERPYIVHTHTPKAGIVGMLAAWLAGVPVRLHTVAGLPVLVSKGLKRRLLFFIEKLTYRFATKVYPNSVNLMNIIRRHGLCPVEKLKVIGNGSSNGINTMYFSKERVLPNLLQEIKLRYNIQKTDFVFIFVGRLVADKGINELVSAFNELTLQKRNIKLLLVGNMESELDMLDITTINLIDTNPHIIMTGFQKDVRPYFAISNCLVFPSYREGFPNVVLQAGAMELPSIVSDINGCNEIVIDGLNGLYVPVKDRETLKNAMYRIITDEDLLIILKKNARSIVQSKFEQRLVWKLLLDEYKSFK